MTKQNHAQKALGRNIREKRNAMGISQKLLAAKAGLSRSHISDLERGTQNARLLTVERIAKALRMDISELFNFEKRRR